MVASGPAAVVRGSTAAGSFPQTAGGSTMQFPFDFELVIDGVRVSEMSGVAVIAAHSDGPAPGADFASWTVAEVALTEMASAARGEQRQTAPLADSHPLYHDLMLSLLNHHRADIDAAWDAYMRTQIAAGHRRFTPRLVPATA